MESGRVLCKNGRHHTVIKRDDGTFASPDCIGAVEEARKLMGVIALGAQTIGSQAGEHGCAHLLALCMGAPLFIGRGATTVDKLGGWKPLYVRYESHRLVKLAVRRAQEERVKKHLPTLATARGAIDQARYWKHWERDERAAHLSDSVEFVPDADVKVGDVVARGDWDQWQVPLQAGWLDNVGLCKPVMEGLFVVGINREHAGFVYAIDLDEDEDAYVVREFAIVGRKLGRVSR